MKTVTYWRGTQKRTAPVVRMGKKTVIVEHTNQFNGKPQYHTLWRNKNEWVQCGITSHLPHAVQAFKKRERGDPQ